MTLPWIEVIAVRCGTLARGYVVNDKLPGFEIPSKGG